VSGNEPDPRPPSPLAEAAAAFRRGGAKLVAAAALALVPASLVAGGALFVGNRAAELRPVPASRAGEAVARAPPDDAGQARQDLLREPARPNGSAPRSVAARAAAVVFATFAFTIGILVAQAAVVALALGEGTSRPVLGACFGEVWKTAFFAAAIVVAGLVCLVLPGILFAVGFSIAMPAVVFERLPAAAALSRSWRLSRRAWPELLAIVVFPAAVVVAVEAAVARTGFVHGPFAHAAIHAALVVVALPFPLALSGFVYLRARSEADHVPLAEVRQYIRRISAPG
jgi:hypothetical protein